MLLAGCAGQQGEGSRAAAPEPGEREQPPPDQIAGEMLLADLDAALLPTAADGDKRRQDEIADERLEPESGQSVVQRGLNAGFVVGLDRACQARPGVLDQAVGRGSGLERCARRLGRGQALVQGGLYTTSTNP